jgi:hypothetical protein
MTRARNLGSTGGVAYISAVNNRVGVGSTNPASTLDVRGDVSIASTVGIGTIINIIPFDTLNNGTLSFEGSAGRLITVANNLSTGSVFSVKGSVDIGSSTGNLGVGTSAPTSKLHVVGNTLITGIVTSTSATVSGTITCLDLNSTSDINLKENIQILDNSLELLQDIRGVKFEWKENNKPSIGVIAQEVEKVFPELVTETETKTVNYNGLIGVLIEAVKELKSENDLLKLEISNIKSHLNIH